MQRAMQIILLGLSVWFTLAALTIVAWNAVIRYVQRRAQNKSFDTETARWESKKGRHA
jgi:TRAP-type mannitol/chloroaromatic compound transport system permease small subunit